MKYKLYSDSNNNFIIINGIKFFIITHIKNITYDFSDFNNWNIETYEENEINIDEDINTYFLLDRCDHNPFSHWIYEEYILIDIYKKIKKIFNIKLLINGKKSFKNLFLKYDNIENDITYSFNKNNIFIIPEPFTSLNLIECNDKNKMLIDNLFNKFEKYNYINNDNKILLMPRGNKELSGNKVSYNIENLINYFNENNLEILYTDYINDIEEQINKISKSKIIIIADGSAILVNGLFIRNSIIIIYGNQTKGQMHYNKIRYIFSKIISNNNIIYYLDNKDSYEITDIFYILLKNNIDPNYLI